MELPTAGKSSGKDAAAADVLWLWVSTPELDVLDKPIAWLFSVLEEGLATGGVAAFIEPAKPPTILGLAPKLCDLCCTSSPSSAVSTDPLTAYEATSSLERSCFRLLEAKEV